MHTKPIVLVIDKNKVSRRVNARLLEGCFPAETRILEMASGEDGLFFCASESVRFVLCDGEMPDLDATELLTRLRALPRGRTVPVVIITDHGDEAGAVRAIKAGAADYLVKGTFSSGLLAESVNRALEDVALRERVDREIAERERAEMSLRRFRDLVDQTLDALFIAEPTTGMLVDVNRAASSELGYAPKELIRLTMRDFLAGYTKPSAWRKLIERLERQGKLTLEADLIRKDETRFPVEVTLRHISRDGEAYLVGVARDITHRKALEERLRDLSNRDGLTGIYNRRFFDETIAREWNRHRREGRPLSLILADVDYFKRYNDTYGHQAGDDCLKQIATCLDQCFRRASDFPARYGGEELVAVVSAPARDAHELANGLREAVAGLAIPHGASDVAGHVTLSIGVATMVPAEGTGPETLIAAADKALYAAKDSGRDRVMVAGDEPG